MEINGLIIRKKNLLQLLGKINFLNNNALEGMDELGTFDWKNFRIAEFKQILVLFKEMSLRGYFNQLAENYTFVINYKNIVTEMDIVTIGSKDNSPIFVDIECKNTTKANDKNKVICNLKKQIKNRVESNLSQLIKNYNYIVLGFVDESYITGFEKDGNILRELKYENEAISQFNLISECSDICEKLKSFDYYPFITNVYKLAKSGNYCYFDTTNSAYNKVIKKIGTEKFCFISGDAGSGKSVLAFKIFLEMKKSKLLLLNSKLYNVLELNKEYSNKRATFNSEVFLNIIDSNTISIVDEYQRLDAKFIKKIIEKSKFTFLFGDDYQNWDANKIDNSMEKLMKELESSGIKGSKEKLKNTRRYSNKVSEALGRLTDFTEQKKEVIYSDYEICLFNDEKEFINKYNNSSGVKKIYIHHVQSQPAELCIGGRTFKKTGNIDDSFSTDRFGDGYYGNTYHAMSFDVDHCFVYLLDTKVIDYYGTKYVYHYGNRNKKDIIAFTNELHVLFTRGRKSLNILTDDYEVYLYFNKILKKLIRK